MKKLADISKFEALGGISNAKSDISVFNVQVPQGARDAILGLGNIYAGAEGAYNTWAAENPGVDPELEYDDSIYFSYADVANNLGACRNQAIDALVQGYTMPENSDLSPEDYLNQVIGAVETDVYETFSEISEDPVSFDQELEIIFQSALGELKGWNTL